MPALLKVARLGGRPAPVVTAAGVVAAAAGDEHTGGGVALIPAAEDAAKLAVEGGTPAEELHLTLAYLGDDVTGWDQEIVDAVQRVALELTDRAAELAGQGDVGPVPAGGDGEDYRGPGQRGPLMLTVFSHSHFNPNGGEHDPCMVYQFSGEGDLGAVESLAGDVRYRVMAAIGEVNFPEQHPRFEPHVTAGYGLDPSALSYTGPVRFDRLRVALGDQVTDYPLGGSSEEDDMGVTAAVSAKQRKAAEEEGDTYPGTDKFPVDTRGHAESAVKLHGNSDIPSADVKTWLIRRLKKKGWEDLIPDSWQSDKARTASAELDDTQRHAITAAALAMVKDLGPSGAYASAPLVFHDPARLAVADEAIELPAAEEADALTAAAASERVLPSVDLFTPPDMPPGTGHYVDLEPLPGGFHRVYGRLAEWHVPHIGASGQTIYPPRSPSGYRYFHTKSAWVQGSDGPEQLKVGHLTFGTGHAPTTPGTTHLAAAAHYDNSGFRGAKVRMTEDQYGPVYAGVTVAGLEGPRLEEFSESDLSGDWRRITGSPLDLVAALCVNIGGFPKIGLSLAASGEPLALVASAKAWGNPAAAVDVDAIADAVVARWEQRQEQKALTAAMTAERDGLLADLDDTPEIVAGLLDELDDPLTTEEIDYIDGLDAPSAEDLAAVDSGLTAAGKRKTWVTETGTGHLPRYIKRIAKHLKAKGKSESHSIAAAVNAVKRMCSGGDTSLPGVQQVGAKARTQACKAVAEWEAKKVQAKAS